MHRLRPQFQAVRWLMATRALTVQEARVYAHIWYNRN
jgi:hypothetical protein